MDQKPSSTHISDEGPGSIAADEIGTYTIAKTTLLDARRTMAYAAGICDDNEAYFDDTRDEGLNVHPAICFSLQWNARHRIDMPTNYRAAPWGVHAETDLRIYQPFKSGEAITTQGQLVKRVQIRPGVFSIERYSMTNSAGELVAELDYNGITRQAILDGPDQEIATTPERPAMENPLNDIPIWTTDILIPRHAGQQYTECADIFNPIHTEPSVAIAAGLPNIILHGSATKAIALTQVVNRMFSGDVRKVTRLYGQLKAMVLMQTTITVECLADQIVEDERQIFFQVRTASGDLAIANGFVTGTV